MSTLTPGRTVPAPIPADRPRRASRGAAGSWWLYALLILGLLLLVGPFIWMILGSFKTTGELRQVPPTWLPEQWTTANYQDLFDRQNFLSLFLNSTIVAFFKLM